MRLRGEVAAAAVRLEAVEIRRVPVQVELEELRQVLAAEPGGEEHHRLETARPVVLQQAAPVVVEDVDEPRDRLGAERRARSGELLEHRLEGARALLETARREPRELHRISRERAKVSPQPRSSAFSIRFVKR